MRARNIVTSTAVLLAALAVPGLATADPREVRHEWREGARSIAGEKREAAREIRRCETRECVLREMREGQREVDRERHEARREVRRERHEGHRGAGHYAGYPQGGDYRYARYDRYDRHDRDAHYHPDGHYCRDRGHIAHLRDPYYRGERRWYRDNRYWGERDYVSRYYRDRQRDDDDDDLVKGILIGGAVVGVIAAIHEANDGD